MTRPRTLWPAVALLLVIALGAAGWFLTHRRDRSGAPEQASASTSSLLVLTWAPSLCEVETSASGCRNGKVGKRGESLLLHGLWPQPREQQYCGVPKHARDRRPIELEPDLRDRLRQLMSDSTVLAPHEWYAHGTCSGVTPTQYFTVATTLAQEAIAVLEPVFDRATGREVSSRSVRDAVDARFGRGTGSRVGLSCRRARTDASVVYEVRLSLPAVAALGAEPTDRRPLSLADALAGAPPIPPGCGRGRLP